MRALVSELKIMVHLGQHLNVVNLLGAVTKNIAQRNWFFDFFPSIKSKMFLIIAIFTQAKSWSLLNTVDLVICKTFWWSIVHILSIKLSVTKTSLIHRFKRVILDGRMTVDTHTLTGNVNNTDVNSPSEWFAIRSLTIDRRLTKIHFN